MYQPTSLQATRKTRRTPRPSLSPYLLDEIGLTLAEIRQTASGEHIGGKPISAGGTDPGSRKGPSG